jgi:uncharacterized damage-inducible protein DinB
MTDLSDELCEELVEETRRRLFRESFPRLRKCLSELTVQEIWHPPNENSNSVGVLTLHLCGNARQWIVSGLGGAKDVRDRAGEFAQKDPIPTSQLLEMLQQLEVDIHKVLERLKPEDLLKDYSVQVFEEKGLSILVHVVEHFSYHVGQITYFVKLRKNIDTGYYSHIEL